MSPVPMASSPLSNYCVSYLSFKYFLIAYHVPDNHLDTARTAAKKKKETDKNPWIHEA